MKEGTNGYLDSPAGAFHCISSLKRHDLLTVTKSCSTCLERLENIALSMNISVIPFSMIPCTSFRMDSTYNVAQDWQ